MEFKYQVMPDLSDEEFAELKTDIAARGVMIPVEYDEDGEVLDGHHRIKVCRELGIDWPKITRFGLDEAGKRLHARKLNLARRHLNQAAKRSLIEEQLKETPEVSNRRIAEGLGVSHPTVATVRSEMESTGKIYQLERTLGADGKSRPTGYRLIDTSPEGKKAIRDSASAVLKSDMPTYTGNYEWYTPAEYIKAARAVLGSIDLDPASNEIAQEVVCAGRYFTAETDGLKQEWSGCVWLNPPYSQPLVTHFVSKLCEEYKSGRVTGSILLVNNYTDNAWFHEAEESAAATCFTRGRIKFYGRGDEKSSPADGQVFIYFGDNVRKFVEVFSDIGVCFPAAVRPSDFAMAQAG
jgi:phage N-6-adenine-methyltransferase